MSDYCLNTTLEESSRKVEELLPILGVSAQKEKNVAVFFDIDGTVSRRDNLEMLMAEIVERDLISHKAVEEFTVFRKKWKMREVDFMTHLDCTVRLIQHLKNFPRALLKKIAQSVIKKNGAQYFVFTWTLLLRLKMLGYKLIAVSGAPDFMANFFLETAGVFVDEVHALEWEFQKGIFTGHIDLTILNDKGKFIQGQYGKSMNLKESLALGDTSGDISMLSVVGKPVAINPNLELATKAKEMGWPIVFERKNVILMEPKGDFML